MSDEEIIALWRAAGFTTLPVWDALKKLGRFARLVAQVEREACAKLCDKAADDFRNAAAKWSDESDERYRCLMRARVAHEDADGIRARGAHD